MGLIGPGLLLAVAQQDCEALRVFESLSFSHWRSDTPACLWCGVCTEPGHSISLFSSPLQGKFIRINFDVTGYIVGANIETCILC